MEQTILIFGTCRIIFDKNNKIFTENNRKYIQQPVHYSTSLSEVINNLEFISGEKNLGSIPEEIRKSYFCYNSHKGKYLNENIKFSDSIAIIELCSKKCLYAGTHLIPYKNLNTNVKSLYSIENTLDKLEYFVDNYKFKAIILIPPIINNSEIVPDVKELRKCIWDDAIYISKRYHNIHLFDWNELFTPASFHDRYHLTDEFKSIVFGKLNRLIDTL